MRRALFLFALASVALAACDKAAPRQPRLAAPPPGVLEPVPVQAPVAAGPAKPKAPPSPITWSAQAGAFVFQGKPLRAEKLWLFDGATDGFVATGGEVQPTEGPGMTYRAVMEDPILRSPKGLNVDGHGRTLVLVRVSRLQAAGGRWDGTVFYATAAHGESADFQAKPLFGGDPAVGETETLVFDMSRLKKGGADWTTSIIEQIRIDLDNAAGGEFLIRQVAIAQAPPGLAPPPPPAPPPAPKAP